MEIGDIHRCLENIKLTRHALKEMLAEEFGEITEDEIRQALKNGEIIENYQEDRPVPSCLVCGNTDQGRMLHVVCTPVIDERTLVVITVYQPDPARWDDYRRRIK